MRLFVAAYPPPAAVEHLAAFIPTLAIGRPPEPGRSLRLAPAGNWHVTLAFLGEVADERAEAAERAVASVPLPQLTVRVAGGGRFGRGRSTTVWAGLRGELDQLDTLARAVRRALKQQRLPVDRKPLQAHLTLARPGDRLPAETVAADLVRLDGYEGPQWTVSDVRLVRSYLGPHPRYEPLARMG